MKVSSVLATFLIMPIALLAIVLAAFGINAFLDHRAGNAFVRIRMGATESEVVSLMGKSDTNGLAGTIFGGEATETSGEGMMVGAYGRCATNTSLALGRWVLNGSPCRCRSITISRSGSGKRPLNAWRSCKTARWAGSLCERAICARPPDPVSCAVARRRISAWENWLRI